MSLATLRRPLGSSSSLVMSVRVLATPLSVSVVTAEMASVWALALLLQGLFFCCRVEEMLWEPMKAWRKWQNNVMETVALVVVKLSVHGCYALGAPVLLGLLDVSYNTCFHPIAFCFITEQVSTLRMSILVCSALGAWPWINRSRLDAGSIWLASNHMNSRTIWE